ncbi:MAG: hypothetical protein KF784_08070 [Fimbriimonadaceae bacterium]|nr:hypothetical protein [Fimbriimonadaceae bacterium]
MPTYVYECSSCNETYEVEQRITEDALTDCHCGSSGTVKRIIQPVGIAFKGGGFYVNDGSSKTPTAPSDAPAAETKSAKAEAKETPKADATPTSTSSDTTAPAKDK